jgi:nitroimidazol reductase NimA-like FMN-containing flavoprotein (pyridoxamine 5'-phosphate oxidase superfamily)
MQSGEPVVLPVNYLFYREAIVFRTARGEKLEAAWRQAPVAFEIDGLRSVSETGWSVLVRGLAEVVEDQEQLDELSTLPFRTWAKGAERPYWVRIRPDEISGRSI